MEPHFTVKAVLTDWSQKNPLKCEKSTKKCQKSTKKAEGAICGTYTYLRHSVLFKNVFSDYLGIMCWFLAVLNPS